MHDWDNFYIAASGASAALTGLLFVGISINLSKILSLQGLPDRALLSLLLLLNVLVISLLFLVPDQPLGTFGIEVLLTGLLSWILISRLDFQVFANKNKQYRRQYLFNVFINQVATILFVVAGISLALNIATAQYWIVPAVLLSIIKAVLEGWVLLVEINR